MSDWAERVLTSYYAMLEYQQACHIAPSLAMPSLQIVTLETSNDDPRPDITRLIILGQC